MALYHNEVVEEEDFSLVRRLLLGLVDVGDLEEPTAAHQPPVRDREDLRKEESLASDDVHRRGVGALLAPPFPRSPRGS